ncbi:MAG: hypothetical protein A3D92_18480 [Bacteroidetes bacterium RIFCSPHIGHO2_02_FULL_44_7]|nr:MAG: hypothetical protein A3D92_18480 [Bacteroidetes bacterium RIFCSPHIGHO2_02_FULL_44_7]
MAEITVVTGLPRSGTSLMMQILDASSLEVYTDGKRERDESNPAGYYELEAVKGIASDNRFLDDAQGKVVKIVAPIITYCKPDLNYRVVFMRREIEEILMSQEKMLNKDQSPEREKFRTIYEFHLKKTYAYLESNKIPYIDVVYGELMRLPEIEIARVVDFLRISDDPTELAKVVRPELYRNKI